MTAFGSCVAPALAQPVQHRQDTTAPPEHEPDTDPGLPSDVGPAVMTIATVEGVETRWGAVDIAARLAALAVTDELVVVCGSDGHQAESGMPPVVAGLRRFLPRHTVVVLYIAPHRGSMPSDATLLDELLELGTLPVVVAPMAAVADVAARLRHRLRADRLLEITGAPSVSRPGSTYARSAA